MTEQVKIMLPKLGESILSATVLQWFKKVGDTVALDEPLLEVSTDKVNSEIPSPTAGVIQEICAHPDQEVQVGELLAVLVKTVETKDFQPDPKAKSAAEGVLPKQTTVKHCAFEEKKSVTGVDSKDRAESNMLTPAVLCLLQEKGIPLSEIDRIPRTGHEGRLTKRDIEIYSQHSAEKSCEKDFCERVKMTGLRKAIAENMVKSFYGAPHASLVTEVDVTNLVKIIKERKEKGLEKFTITSFVARAIARSISSYPLINSSLEEDTIVLRRFVNLGIAVSIDQGVMVPVIRNCQNLEVFEISRKILELAEKARTNTLAPDDVKEGTITMTNFGMTGTQIGIPIIRYPEVAIIGLGAIHKKVQAMADDSIAIRSVMMISLTFDHRILDGLYGCGFLNEIKKQLETTPEIVNTL